MKQPETEDEVLVKTITTAVEVIGCSLSTSAVKMMALELEQHPFQQVINALHKCARECRFKLTLADVIERIDDGRPGWAPRDTTRHVPRSSSVRREIGEENHG